MSDEGEGFVDAMVSAVLQADERELAEDAAEAGEDLGAAADRLRARFLARVAQEQEPADVESTTVRIGRYPILRRLGAGGMGVVYAAYDEALDRRLAIKVLHDLTWDGDGRRRERLIREAQAMAKVTHPNLVTVHEVGSHENQLFIAMEFVSGPTLRQWYELRKHSWREIVAVFIQIAEGLAALHDAGLVHRDVKPANVIIGDDGRVRVLDLGLVGAKNEESSDGERVSMDSSSSLSASESASLNRIEGPLTMTGERLGTPAYMAREQFLGLPSTPASDIFSFSVVLYEALFGIHPFMAETYSDLQANVVNNKITPPSSASAAAIPTWLTSLVIRGFAPDPKDRPPSMHAFAAALARDPSRTRRRWLATLGVAVLAGLAGVAVARSHTSAPEKTCDGAEQVISEVWDASRANEIRKAMVATKQPYAEALANRITVGLDAYASDWAAAHGRVCEEHARGDHSDALLDARMACLHRRRQALDVTATLLAETDAELMAHAGEMVAKLPRIEACDDLTALSSQSSSRSLSTAELESFEALESKLVLVEAFANAGRVSGAIELAREVAAEAEKLGDEALLAEALLAEARASVVLPADGTAAALERALALAIAEKLDALAAEAMIIRIYVRGLERGGSQVALADLPIAEAMLVRSGSGDELRALLENNAGSVYLAEGDRVRAREAYERSIAIKARLYGEDHLELARGLGNLAILAPDEQTRADLHRRMIDIFDRRLGPEHPRTLDARFLAAMQMTDPLAAGDALAAVCPRLRKIDRHLAGECELEQGRLEYARGRFEVGRPALESAREDLAADHEGRVLLDAYLALGSQGIESVIQGLREEIAAVDEQGAGWWAVLVQAEHRLLLAWLLPDPAGNIALLEQVLVDLERISDKASASEGERLLALTRGTLAKNLAAVGKHDRAAALAADARRFYERWPQAYVARLEELEALKSPMRP